MAEFPVRLPSGVGLPEGLLEAFWEYERALMADDLQALDSLFASGPDTLRGDDAGLIVGHDAISAFRRGRGGAPPRRILAVHVRPIGDDAALVVAVTAPAAGGRGQQTQLWRRAPGGWVVDAAHVSVPAPAIARSTWRTVGSPLVAGAGSGPLAGHTVAVKDLFAVAGFPVGAGVPDYLAEAPIEHRHASALAALIDAGASVQGIAQTDEFAYSIAGRNPHYGTPPNGAVPGAIAGGSSSGPATAVAMGQATIGLGTDTGGSIRVPASYQGLWGLRTTHGAVSVSGLLPLAPAFDTVGWLTRDAATLALAAAATLGPVTTEAEQARFVVAPALVAAAGPDVGAAFDSAVERIRASGLFPAPAAVDLGDIDTLFETFRVVQAAEAWRSHGEWITRHPDALGTDVAARFAVAARVSREQEAAAREAHAAAAARIQEVLGDRILLVPSASSAAPSVTADARSIDAIRSATLRLTCIAGLSGRPALSVPALTVPSATGDAAPVGLCLVGPHGSDLALVRTGMHVADALGIH